MASYMFFHVVPNSHLDFLREHPEAFRAYMEGRAPEARRSLLDKLLGREVELNPPENWPTAALEGFSPEVNHRQVEHFHHLLNGTSERVDHAGCIFQTWFAPRHKTVAVTIDGENFALYSRHVPDLIGRIEKLTREDLLERYRRTVDDKVLSASDQEFLHDVFREISAACHKALEDRAGLMWTAG